MARLDYTRATEPALLQQIAALTSVELAVRFARKFGDQKVYFPRKVWASHAIARCLGLRAAERICRELAGEEYRVPVATTNLRWLDARALLVLDVPKGEIAELLNLSRRQVNHLLQDFDPAGIEIDDVIRQVGRHYGIGRERMVRAAAQRRAVCQLDFGWPVDAKGMRFTAA